MHILARPPNPLFHIGDVVQFDGFQQQFRITKVDPVRVHELTLRGTLNRRCLEHHIAPARLVLVCRNCGGAHRVQQCPEIWAALRGAR